MNGLKSTARSLAGLIGILILLNLFPQVDRRSFFTLLFLHSAVLCTVRAALLAKNRDRSPLWGGRTPEGQALLAVATFGLAVACQWPGSSLSKILVFPTAVSMLVGFPLEACAKPRDLSSDR